MKYLISILLLLFINISNYTYSQLWKQYADSAKVFSDQKNFNVAIDLYTKAKEELNKDSLWTNSYARICNSLGDLYYDTNQFQKAELLYLEAKKVREIAAGKESRAYAASCNNLANLYADMGQFSRADSFYNQARKILATVLGTDHPDYAHTCKNLGRLYFDMSLYDKAEPLYLECRQIFKKAGEMESSNYIQSCVNLGILYERMNQYENAELYRLEILQMRERLLGKEHPDYGQSCHDLGNLYNRIGLYQKAEPLMITAKQIWEKTTGKEHRKYASACMSLANLFWNSGQNQKAEPLYIEARQVYEKIAGRINNEYATCCLNLGNFYWKTGQYEKAEPLMLEGKQITEKVFGKYHDHYAAGCMNLAGLYTDQGQYEKAEPLILESREIKGKVLGKSHPDYAKSCSNLGSFYFTMGQYKKAEPLFLETDTIMKNVFGRNSADYALIRNNLAALYRQMGQYQKAGLLFVEAKQIREKVLGKNHPEYAYSCDNLGRFYNLISQYQKAEPLLLEAKTIREKVFGKQHIDYAASCFNLGVLYQNTGKYESAETILLEAKQIREKMLGKEHADYIESCSRLAGLYWNQRRMEEAKELYFESFTELNKQLNKIFLFTSEKEKQLYLKKTSDLENYILSFLKTAYPYSGQSISYNVSLSGRYRILNASQNLRQAIYDSGDSLIKEKFSEWISAREQLSLLYSRSVMARPVYVTDIEVKADAIEKELTRLSANFEREKLQKNITWKEIQEALKPDEAAIEFVSFPFFNGRLLTDSLFYCALLLTKNKTEPEMIPLFESRQINKLLTSGNTINTISVLYHTNKNAGAAYNLIWAPIEKHLKGISTIYFAPAGLLYRISFHALPLNDGQVLSDKYRLVQLKTTASITNQSESFIDTADRISLYGGIMYDADTAALRNAVSVYGTNSLNLRSIPGELVKGSAWRYLPGTQKEVNEIKLLAAQKKHNAEIFDGIRASEESIRALNGKLSPSVLHIATHGFFFADTKQPKNETIEKRQSYQSVFHQAEDPLFRSGILFAGANHAWLGKNFKGLEDGILTAYEVSNLYLPNTRLVVLSACETGLGDIQGNEGVYGLQRAFKIAGVDNLVMSLWKIPDQATAEFMQEFYKNIFNRQSIQDAFYRAQATMKNRYRKEPYKWAAWILVR